LDQISDLLCLVVFGGHQVAPDLDHNQPGLFPVPHHGFRRQGADKDAEAGIGIQDHQVCASLDFDIEALSEEGHGNLGRIDPVDIGQAPRRSFRPCIIAVVVVLVIDRSQYPRGRNEKAGTPYLAVIQDGQLLRAVVFVSDVVLLALDVGGRQARLFPDRILGRGAIGGNVWVIKI